MKLHTAFRFSSCKDIGCHTCNIHHNTREKAQSSAYLTSLTFRQRKSHTTSEVRALRQPNPNMRCNFII